MPDALDPVARSLAIGHTATTAPPWCALLMARVAFGGPACASAAKRRASLTRRRLRRRSRSPRPCDLFRRAQRSHYGRAADVLLCRRLGGVGHARFVALGFAVSFAPLMASQVELAREIRVYMANVHLE